MIWSWPIALMVAAGGALGALARWQLAGWATRGFGPAFPFGTFAVNVTGGLAMGLLAAALLERSAGDLSRAAPFLITGILGGFTTFSAFSLDAVHLLERGRPGLAALYVGGSVALSIGALWAGLALGRAIWGQG